MPKLKDLPITQQKNKPFFDNGKVQFFTEREKNHITGWKIVNQGKEIKFPVGKGTLLEAFTKFENYIGKNF